MQLVRLLVNLLHRQGALYQPLKEGATGKTLELLELLLVFPQIVLLLPFPFDLLAGGLQRLDHIRPCQRLQQILIHVQGDGLTGILKVTVAAGDNDFGFRQLTADDPAERQAVHKGHTDIGDQDIRLHPAQHGKRHFAVRCVTHKLKAVFFPGDHIPKPLTDNAFILSNKHFQQIHRTASSHAVCFDYSMNGTIMATFADRISVGSYFLCSSLLSVDLRKTTIE